MTTATPISIFRRLAGGEISLDEARIALASLTPSTPTKSPQRIRKPIGKRHRPSTVKWAQPIASWDDVKDRYQYALRHSPDRDPWEVFLAARREYLAHCQ